MSQDREHEMIDPAQLTARLQARARTEPDLAVDAARLAGVGKLAIAVTPREAGR